jgi:transmembrane sensor
MSRIDIEDVLDRYLKGEASAGEIDRVEAWLNQNGNTNADWQHMDKPHRAKWLSDLFNEIQADAGISEPKVVALRPRVLWLRIASVAAVLTIFFAAYLMWPSKSAQLITLDVGTGEKHQVALTDGSKIWINSASQLKYPGSFNGKTREVYLSGEAYFDIQHDATKPFIIHTGKVVTTVLGTAFNIKEDNAAHTVVVTVTRGKVSVANGSEQLGVITPNQQISFNTVSLEHSRQNVDANRAIAWQDDIHFEDITFADAAAQLQQRFGVKISFANENVKNCRFTGTALKGEKLDKILKVICAFNNAAYKTRNDGSIIIDGPGCN